MKIKYIIIVLIAFSGSLLAQHRSLIGITYSVSLATGKTNDFINDVGYVGFYFDAKKSFGRNTWGGLSFGWNVMAEETNEMVHIENEEIGADLSGNQGRYINSFPILANFSYAFRGSGRSSFVPYIGLNAGIYIINQRFNIGVYQFDNNNTHFGGAPELGFIMKSGSVNVLFYTRYNYAFDSGTRLDGDEKNDHSYLQFNLGIAYDRVGF
jgi:hypothetical protein